MRGVARLVDRRPTVSPERLIAQLTPPPTFADASFAGYHPDPAEPTQSAAVAACQRSAGLPSNAAPPPIPRRSRQSWS